MNPLKIGVLGAGRGRSMMNYCRHSKHARLVAVCDNNPVFLDRVKRELDDESVIYDSSFETFLSRDIDAVVLANFANEHAPFAIRCLKAGKHVISEVLPCQNMKEAVELVEAVESSGKIYTYAENYCYMPAPREMKRLYDTGELGEFEYGEGEYMHNCEPIWPDITQGNPDHWRNNISATFYCTHSIGPLIHISGLRPVRVSGFELPYNARTARMGAKSGSGAVEMITLENGAVIKSLHGLGISRNSIWYSIYGSKGRLESAREDAQADGVSRLYKNLDTFEGENADTVSSYEPKDSQSEEAKSYGHGSSDYYTMYNAIEKILGNSEADAIDVYEALDMFLPGLFAYRSILQGGAPMEIPDLRNREIRDQYRNDTACSDKKAAGEQYIPSYSKGNPEVPPEIYQRTRERWLQSLEEQQDKS